MIPLLEENHNEDASGSGEEKKQQNGFTLDSKPSSGSLSSPTKHTSFLSPGDPDIPGFHHQQQAATRKRKTKIITPDVLHHTPEIIPEDRPHHQPSKPNRQKLEGIMRNIPQDAEATSVLVGELSGLEKPALCFVRLAEGTILNGLTEVPIPVRFLFVLLGPESSDKVDYHEIGRCFSTLMSNEVRRQEILEKNINEQRISNEDICDMIKRNESDVGHVVLEILAKTVFKYLCLILFVALTNPS